MLLVGSAHPTWLFESTIQQKQKKQRGDLKMHRTL
jgi:hypothetical protein